MNSSLYDHLEAFYEISITNLVKLINKELPNVIKKYTIVNSNGKAREVIEVNNNSIIWNVQKFLKDSYFSKLNLPECSFGFQKNKSYFQFLSHHANYDEEAAFLKLDIKNFFSSIKSDNLINDLVSEFEDNNIKKSKLKELLKLVLCFEEKVPQGFQTSPVLSNYYLFRVDLRIQKYCEKLSFRYSRYADDMLFSATINKKFKLTKLLPMVRNILNDFDLKLNSKKTKFSINSISLNGFVVSSEVRLSQKKLKELRRVLFIGENTKKSDGLLEKLNNDVNGNFFNKKRKFSKEYLINYLSGYRSFLISSIKDVEVNGDWFNLANKLIIRIENLILKIY